ncbi:hypothetical protein RB6005 [Rhodopirellula baltica SH 1]|uniref:Uncharacterized protein n=1 Tax=Rhodopirellula baltica (strain DSM 10527 / NCIMB 13988 / SH1) TaxID=243090 RepID=Q7UQY3_RHOBA|nr:hypothetical protein RB6005 [Rhodopirellula baltica SH 1]
MVPRTRKVAIPGGCEKDATPPFVQQPNSGHRVKGGLGRFAKRTRKQCVFRLGPVVMFWCHFAGRGSGRLAVRRNAEILTIGVKDSGAVGR